MPAAPSDARMLISTTTFASTDRGLTRAINGENITEWMTVRRNGKVGPGARGIVGRDGRIVLTWEGDAPATPGTKGTLVVNWLKMDGTTAATPWTWQNVKAGTFTAAGSDDRSAPGMWTQEFILEDDHDTEQFSG